MEKLVRRPNAVILFISLSLLMMLTTGCQEIKLKAGIEAANKQCPIDMGETGKITSIVYDGENVVYTFYLNEEAANIKTLQKNPESMKTSLKIMFQNPNKEVKSLLSDEAVIYICRVDEDLCDMNQIKANAAEVKQGIIETLGNQTDLATQLFIKSCVNCDRNIVYRYIGKQSEAQHDVVITVPELKDMLKKE